MEQIIIVSDDRPGILANISHILGNAGMNILGVNVSLVNGRAIISILIKNRKKATELLEHNGYKVLTQKVLVVKMKDRPGEHAKLTKKLASRGINIESMNMIAKEEGAAIYAVAVDKYQESKKILKSYLI